MAEKNTLCTEYSFLSFNDILSVPGLNSSQFNSYPFPFIGLRLGVLITKIVQNRATGPRFESGISSAFSTKWLDIK